jgi:hypothetical protein
MTSETVVGETPASLATSLTVDDMDSDPFIGCKLSPQVRMWATYKPVAPTSTPGRLFEVSYKYFTKRFTIY